MDLEETIVATASTHDTGGARGIVRISGKDAMATVSAIFQPDEGQLSTTSAVRMTGKLQICEPIGEVPSDAFLWPTVRSYTRQPTVELHLYGALPLLNAVVETVCHQGARLARPGEFTLRAFLAGRIDLAQAEAVLGVIDAEDQKELNVALSQLAGGLSQPLDQLRNTLLNLCADLEAGLDFVDEDIEFITQEQVQEQLHEAQKTIADAEQRMSHRSQTGQLPRVVLRGEPNVGKSSLWNAMCRDLQALVTSEAGTTRDYLTGIVELEGQRFELVDTAGVEKRESQLGEAMQDKAEQQTAHAQLVLLCIDSTRPLTEWERNQLANHNGLVVLTKSDQTRDASLGSCQFDCVTSDKDESTIEGLVRACVEALAGLDAEATVVASTSVRCRESLRQAKESIETALGLAENSVGDELVAAEVRTALEHLGQIVGVIYTDDILDRVFSRFCIGK